MPKLFTFFFFFFLEPFQVGRPKQESRRKETKQSITQFRNKIRIQTKSNKTYYQSSIIKGPSVCTNNTCFFGKQYWCYRNYPLWLWDRHLDMFYNAKYLSWHRLIPKASGLEFFHIKWVSVGVWPRVLSLMFLSTTVQSSNRPMQLYFSNRVPLEGAFWI